MSLYNKKLTALCLFISSHLMFSCSSTQKSLQKQASQEQPETAITSGDDASSYSDHENEGIDAINAAMPGVPNSELATQPNESTNTKGKRTWPQNNEQWAISLYTTENKGISENIVKSCMTELEQLALISKNTSDLLSSSDQFKSSVNTSPEAYHLCFFNEVASLDSGLQKNNLAFDKKMDLFLQQMNKLWIISKALSTVVNDPRYFNITRSRYIKYSNEYFGRNLDTLGESLSH